MSEAATGVSNPAARERRRFSAADIERWRTDGFAIVTGFFARDEIAPIVEDYDRLYGARRPEPAEPMNRKAEGQIGRFDRHQFSNIDTLPYAGSTAMNLLSLHPGLIDFAKAALGASEVHLYQSHTWAKFTGEADFDQPFHCDFGNHTLTVPADEPYRRTIDFIIYLTDVTDAHGAPHYVTKPDAREAVGEDTLVADSAEAQTALKARARSAAAPAGTVVAHGIDTFHRGTNLTCKGGHRYTMTIGYKAAGNDQIGFHVWQASAVRNWAPILTSASPEQLAVLGIPRPGDPFWTPRTLSLTQRRWPDWDLTPWFERAPAR